jgi:hypothetical protein
MVAEVARLWRELATRHEWHAQTNGMGVVNVARRPTTPLQGVPPMPPRIAWVLTPPTSQPA